MVVNTTKKAGEQLTKMKNIVEINPGLSLTKRKLSVTTMGSVGTLHPNVSSPRRRDHTRLRRGVMGQRF